MMSAHSLVSETEGHLSGKTSGKNNLDTDDNEWNYFFNSATFLLCADTLPADGKKVIKHCVIRVIPDPSWTRERK